MARRSSKLASFGAAGRTRADARAIEFVDRRGLLEIFEHVGVLRDLLTIDPVRFLRHLFDGFFPRPAFAGWSGAGQCFETGGDHQFQIPFRQNRVGIFPVEDFALLGDANLSGETAGWLRENRRVRGAASASNGAAAPMKQTKLHMMLVGGAVQFAMSLVQFPRAGEHAAVFIRVGVAEHDFLPASPGIEQGSILRISPEAAHDVGRGAQRVNGFKQRDRHQARIVRRARHLHSAPALRGGRH